MFFLLAVIRSLLFSIFALYSFALADEYVWTGECGGTRWDACCSRGSMKVGNWDRPPMSTCSVQLYPRSGDDAVINSGTLEIYPGRNVNSLVSGSQATVNNVFVLTTQLGYENHGTHLVGDSSQIWGPIFNYGLFHFAFDSARPYLIAYGPFINHEQIDFISGATISGGSSGALENRGTGSIYIHPNANETVSLNLSPPNKFTNLGSIIIEGTSATTSPLVLAAPTENFGEVTLNAPFVNWTGYYENGPGSFTTKNVGALFTLNGSSILNLSSGTHLFDGATIAGSGSVKLGSSMTIRGNNSILTPFTMEANSGGGPWLDLESDLILPSRFTWRDGFIRAKSLTYWPTLTLSGDSSIGQDSYVYLQGAKIKNSGFWDWRGTYGIIYSDYNGFIPMIENDGTIVSNGASLDFQGTGVGTFPWQMPFRNDGLLRILGSNVTDLSGVYLENNGEIRVEGGDLRVDTLRNITGGEIFLNGFAAFGGVTFGSGSFSLKDMITAFVGNAITFGAGNSPGRIRGHGHITGDAFFTNGYIDSFDLTSRLLKFFNSLGLAERSTIILELAGRDNGSAQPPHDIIEAASIRLGGTLDLRLSNGYAPQLGDSFSIIRSPNIRGEFDAIRGARIGSEKSIVLEKTNSGIIARVGNVRSISAASDQLVVGETPRYLNLRAEVADNGTGLTLSSTINGSAEMTSSDPSILSFDSDGRAVAHRAGTVNVTATYQGHSLTYPVYVTTASIGKASIKIEPVSKGYLGGPATGSSQSSYLTRDGRYVVYESNASNLVSEDSNGQKDVFRYNVSTRLNEIVSVTSAGVRGNGDARFPAPSRDGRFVAYKTTSTNQGLQCSAGCVMLKDMSLNTLTHVSRSVSNGAPNNLIDDYPISISDDGNHIVFTSRASNLVSGDTNGASDIFVFNRVKNTTSRISVSGSGAQANGESAWPNISGNGRFVLFSSKASNLVAGDTNSRWDLFIYDRDPDSNGVYDEGNGTTTRVNTTSSGAQANEQNDSSVPLGTLNYRGTEVVFQSSSSQLITGDTNGKWDIFLKDISTNSVTRLSTDQAGMQLNESSYRPWISSDGRFVSFYSLANVTEAGGNQFSQVYVIDRGGLKLNNINIRSLPKDLVSLSKHKMLGDGNSGQNSFPTISDDGTLVAFSTLATNLFTDDITLFSDVVLARRPILESSEKVRR